MDKNKGIALAKKVKALVEQGVEGERENAKIILNEIIKKYSLTEEDISEEVRTTYWFQVLKRHEKVFGQTASTILGGEYYTYSNPRKRNQIGLKFTKCESILFKKRYKIYKESFDTEFEIFQAAFIRKNNIYPKTEPGENIRSISDLTKEELEEYYRIEEMASNIKKQNIYLELKK